MTLPLSGDIPMDEAPKATAEATFIPVARLIEVKCTIVSPLRFYLTRNEWNQALQFGSAYHFHIWDLAQNPPKLYQRTAKEIEPHVPTDNEKGRRKDAEIPVGVPRPPSQAG